MSDTRGIRLFLGNGSLKGNRESCRFLCAFGSITFIPNGLRTMKCSGGKGRYYHTRLRATNGPRRVGLDIVRDPGN